MVAASSDAGSDLSPGRVVIRHGDGSGAFQDTSDPPLSVPPGPRVATLADVNGDQRPDVVLGHTGSRLSVLLNRGDRTFAPAPGSPYVTVAQPFAVVVADANRDGKPDLLAATVDDRSPPYDSSVTVLLGNGRGFDPAPGSPFRVGQGTYNLEVADVNQDGKLDVASPSFEGSSVTVLLGQ